MTASLYNALSDSFRYSVELDQCICVSASLSFPQTLKLRVDISAHSFTTSFSLMQHVSGSLFVLVRTDGGRRFYVR